MCVGPESMAHINPEVCVLLCDDNARLRAVIHEAMKQKFMTNLCPWCRQSIDSIDDVHESDCLAFTPEGVVK